MLRDDHRPVSAVSQSGGHHGGATTGGTSRPLVTDSPENLTFNSDEKYFSLFHWLATTKARAHEYLHARMHRSDARARYSRDTWKLDSCFRT